MIVGFKLFFKYFLTLSGSLLPIEINEPFSFRTIAKDLSNSTKIPLVNSLITNRISMATFLKFSKVSRYKVEDLGLGACTGAYRLETKYIFPLMLNPPLKPQ